MEGLSFYYLLQLLFSVFYSFHCCGLSFPWLVLLLGIYLFWGSYEWDCFPDIFLSLFIIAIWKKPDFYVSILYHDTLFKVFIWFNTLPVESLGFSITYFSSIIIIIFAITLQSTIVFVSTQYLHAFITLFSYVLTFSFY
jgi:hypothetical protein